MSRFVDAMTVVRNALLAADGRPLSATEIADSSKGGLARDAVIAAVSLAARNGELVRHHNPDGVLRYTLTPQRPKRGKRGDSSFPLTERVDAAIVSGHYDTRDVMVAVGGACALSEVAQALRRLEKRGVVEREVVDNITLWRRVGTPAKGPAAPAVVPAAAPVPAKPAAKATALPAAAKAVAVARKATAPSTAPSTDPFSLTGRLAVVSEDAENLVHDAMSDAVPDTVAKHLVMAAFELSRAHRALLSLSQAQGAHA